MSQINIKGHLFAILNARGDYELYGPGGEKIGCPYTKIRITQTVDDIDFVVICAPINVVRNEEEMQQIINGEQNDN